MESIAVAETERNSINELLAHEWEEIRIKATHRDLVLKAVAEGYNTLGAILEITELGSSVVLYELDMLEGILISKLPAPPKTSWWIKGREPKGRIYIKNGKAIEVDESVGIPAPYRTKKSKSEKRLEKAAAKFKSEPKELDVSALENAGEYKEISISEMEPHPDNPRILVNTDEQSFINLSESIREVGVQEPLVVTPNHEIGKFRIVMGHRRFEAAKVVGLERVPCIVRRYESREAELIVMLIENIQRQGLQPTQEGKAFHKLYIQLNKDIHAVARKVGLTQSYIVGRMRLLKLDEGIQLMIDRRELNVSAGVVLSQLPIQQQKTLVVRAPRMRLPELKEVVEKLKSGVSSPLKRSYKKNKTRVIEGKEDFTRSWALGEIDKLGDAWITTKFLKDSFDDVCQDACAQSKDESLCKACPVPRFIASILRRKERSEQE